MSKVLSKVVTIVGLIGLLILALIYVHMIYNIGLSNLGIWRSLVSIFSNLCGNAIIIILGLTMLRKNSVETFYGFRFELIILALALLALSFVLLKNRVS